MRVLLLFSLFVTSIFGFSFTITNSTIANGKTSLIKFKKDKDTFLESIKIDKKEYKITDNYVYIPVSYYQKPKSLKVVIFYKEKSKQKQKTVFFKVVDGGYAKEEIHVAKGKVSLNDKDKKRAAKEYKEAMKIYNTFTPKNYVNSKYIMPLNSKITSDFGKARVYNDTLKGYHSGTDFRAKVGTPIKATNDGVVVLAKDRFYSGGSIIIDHGYGVYSCYYHMSKFDVKKGDKVKKGQIIGLSGVSGRVTGPHLHFSFRVYGVQVDPLQFIELVNKEVIK